MIKSLELAPAVILQPFNYFILVWAMVIGYSFYGEILDTTTLIGASLVIGSGVYRAPGIPRGPGSPASIAQGNVSAGSLTICKTYSRRWLIQLLSRIKLA